MAAYQVPAYTGGSGDLRCTFRLAFRSQISLIVVWTSPAPDFPSPGDPPVATWPSLTLSDLRPGPSVVPSLSGKSLHCADAAVVLGGHGPRDSAEERPVGRGSSVSRFGNEWRGLS